MSDIGLIGYWKFEDNALDSSGNNNHGTVTGCAYADGKFGRCITINNSGDKIDYGNIFGMNGATELTFLAWIKFNSIEGDYDICSKGIHSSSTPILFWRDEIASLGAQAGNTNCLSVIVYDGDTAPWTSSPSGSMNDTNWHHVGFTFKANTIAGLKIYIDANNSTNCNTTNCNNIASSMAPFIIGTNTEGTFVLNGSIDEVKLYTRTLSQEEIEEEYNKTLEHFTIKNSEKGLIGYWKLEDNTIDSSGNNEIGNEYNIIYTTGKINRCGSFNGSNSYISIPHNEIQNLSLTGTIMLWAYSNRSYPSDDNNNKYRPLVTKTSGGGNAAITYFIDWYGTNSTRILRCHISNGTILQGITSSFDFNEQWNHIIYTFDGMKHKLYINGEQYGSSITQTISAQILETAINIGRGFGGNYIWDGLIDEVKIYNRALSDAEANAEYNKIFNQFKIKISEKGLIGYWKLEDNAIDDSGNENNGETYNITYSNGKIGRCGNFNGTNSYIETNISSIFNIGTTLTVCAWILRNTNNADYESIVNHIQKTSPYSGYWIGSMSNGKIMAFVGPYTNQIFTTNTISNGEWHHVALISNGTTFAIWIDGNKASEDKSVETVANDVTIRIGRSILTGEYFDGLIDEVRIYDHAFSQEKIETLYNDTNNTFRLIL